MQIAQRKRKLKLKIKLNKAIQTYNLAIGILILLQRSNLMNKSITASIYFNIKQCCRDLQL